MQIFVEKDMSGLTAEKTAHIFELLLCLPMMHTDVGAELHAGVNIELYTRVSTNLHEGVATERWHLHVNGFLNANLTVICSRKYVNRCAQGNMLCKHSCRQMINSIIHT